MSNNPYVQHIVEMTGESEREIITSMMPTLRPMTFPCVIHGRTFESHDHYMNELCEYINGLWTIIYHLYQLIGFLFVI